MNALKSYCCLLSTIISLLLFSESGLAQDSDVADIILHHGVVEVVDDSFRIRYCGMPSVSRAGRVASRLKPLR
ncbi:hypothetical protein SRABI112_00900 [Pseudomonas mediterranea]|uniref:Uncharacterized protein n=1 Tax=Pseudomonas mediterranea TaxID=183795 RepID=A0AAX2DFG3_9PSED|nr:hypothetical protein ALQ97_200070 [Pseudomonas savastanoi pv. glycinea]CAH0159898.1 hypothetical protein SRABI112_00900 [Pseudomonas mediterranea]SDU66514.1 hypothetical protein SAMN05216476_4122 [Pseudomonas mediterranea]